MRFFVILICGHSTVVTHEKGDRVIVCDFPTDKGKCGIESVVTAKEVKKIEFDVHPFHAQLKLLEF